MLKGWTQGYPSALSRLRKRAESLVWECLGFPRRSYGPTKGRERTLLIYRIEPFVWQPTDPFLQNHQNLSQCRLLADLILERHLSVDVIDWRDRHLPSLKEHRLLVGMGGSAARMARILGPSVPKIYLGTGAEPSFAESQIEARAKALHDRRGVRITVPRRELKREDLTYFDAVACFGNDHTAQTYRRHHDRVYHFPNYAHPTLRYLDRNVHDTRSRFLYLGSSQHLVRGLDLLVEVFASRPGLELYICGGFRKERDLLRCYRRELSRSPNIHVIGWVPIPGRLFEDLSRRCAYVIHPSATEGQAGAVLDGMATGLVPIVSTESGVDVEDCGLELVTCSIEEIGSTVDRAASMDEREIARQSRKARMSVDAKYRREHFANAWQAILDEVLPWKHGSKAGGVVTNQGAL